jgi:arsenite methyltransferase
MYPISLFDELPLWSAPFGLRLLETVEMRPGIRALDVGFGTGFPLLELAQRLGASSQVYGIDPWKDAIHRADWKRTSLPAPNVMLVRGSAEALPFPAESFDLIVSNNGINNVHDIQSAISECFRVSKSGAQFVLTQNLPTSMEEFYSVYRTILSDHHLTEALERLEQHIFEKRKPLAWMQHTLSAAGFSVSRIIEESFALRFLDGTSLFAHAFIRLAFLDSWKGLLPPSHQHLFRELEERLNILAREKSELRLSIPFACFDCRKE